MWRRLPGGMENRTFLNGFFNVNAKTVDANFNA